MQKTWSFLAWTATIRNSKTGTKTLALSCSKNTVLLSTEYLRKNIDIHKVNAFITSNFLFKHDKPEKSYFHRPWQWDRRRHDAAHPRVWCAASSSACPCPGTGQPPPCTPSTLTEAINSSILKINIGTAMGGGGLEINNCNLKQEQLFCKLYSNFLIDTELFIVKK